MNRKRDGLLPLEATLLSVGLLMKSRGDMAVYGYDLLKKLLAETVDSRVPTHGAVYKALGRLEERGFVIGRWEDEGATAAGRPRRKLYEVTAAGSAVLERYEQVQARPSPSVVWKPARI